MEMTLSQELVAEKSSNSKKGKWCFFVPLSETEGVKFYHTKDLRNQAAELQEQAASVSLGPKVGEYCEMPALQSWEWPENWPLETEKVYGYITQIAEIRILEEEEMDYLRCALEAAGLSTNDIHKTLNVGLINGMPVRIDFDPEFYWDDELDNSDDSEYN